MMVPTLAFSLLTHTNKQFGLEACILNCNNGVHSNNVYVVTPDSFEQLQGAPFAYWISTRVKSVFAEFPPFDNEELGRATRCGLGTLDDFRFLRLSWEVPLKLTGWVTYYHGGTFRVFYDEYSLLVQWASNGYEIKRYVEQKVGSASRKVQGEERYFVQGFVFPRRTKGFAPKFMPPGGIFSTAGQAGFAATNDLAWTIGLLASRTCTFLLSLSQGRTGDAAQYEVGLVKRLPWPTKVSPQVTNRLSECAISGYRAQASIIRTGLTDRWFTVPAILVFKGNTLSDSLDSWSEYQTNTAESFELYLQEIDEIALQLYGLTEKDIVGPALADNGSISGSEIAANEDDRLPESMRAPRSAVSDLLDYLVGLISGYWDIRIISTNILGENFPNPYVQFPRCPPGMLQSPAGLPATPADVPADYPLRISWPGILVSDPGHAEDLVSRVQEALAVIWPDTYDAIEQEACGLLGVPSLAAYFNNPSRFFADHLSRYSKSRRQAPIYWPLSTSSASYTLWLYYHRLTDQTLYQCINDFVDPKRKQVTEQLGVLQRKQGRSREEERTLEQLAALDQELADLRAELLRVAAFWKPDLNDGVQITAAPLHRLFNHRPWRKRLQETWEALETGEYDWAHLAYSIWPQRVAEKCRTDKSLAIAHNLEHLYVEPATAKAKGKRGKGRAAQDADAQDAAAQSALELGDVD